MLSGGEPHDCGKDDYRNSNHPPRNIILLIEPIYFAGGQRKDKNYCQKYKRNFFIFINLLL